MDMNYMSVGEIFINGQKTNRIDDIDWNEHPKFKGVFIKNLLTGSDSNNYLSAMMVKIEPYMEIGLHKHDGQGELHEVIAGNATAFIGEQRIDYVSGVISFVPVYVEHRIQASADGITMLAKFTPSL